MEYKEVIEKLKSYGTEQNIKVYKKHGAKDEIYGVSIANLKKIKKEIKVDTQLAIELWQGKNYDGMILAMLIINPKEVNLNLIKDFIKDVDNYMTCFYLAEVIGKSTVALEVYKLWKNEEKEYYQACAFDILSILLKNNEDIPDKIIENTLDYIKNNIHKRKNRAKYSMNNTLIAIGVYSEKFREEAIYISKEVGRVEVNHGDTSCKTPLAHEYIDKSLKRQKKLHM